MKLLTLVPLFAFAYAASEEVAMLPAPSASGKNGEKILPRFSQTSPKDGARRVVKKYGSYMVSSARMMQTTKMVQGPCGGTCYVTAMEATIRYPGGKEANVDTGAWLHHIALFGQGAGAGSIWAAGNERPTLRLNNEKKYGIAFPSMFMLMIDLMVEGAGTKNLTLEITYETVPKTRTDYKAARMYWLTIGEPAAKQGKYTFPTMPQTSGVTGSLLYAIGHMHDGGTHMDLQVGGRTVCKSVMHYGSRTGYGAGGESMGVGSSKSSKGMGKMAGMSHAMLQKRQHAHGSGANHISDPGACTDFGTVRAGESMRGVAYYDASSHKLMMHNGKAERLMGNMRVYIGPEGLAGALTGGKSKSGGGLGGLGGLGGKSKSGGGLGGLGGLGKLGGKGKMS